MILSHRTAVRIRVGMLKAPRFPRSFFIDKEKDPTTPTSSILITSSNLYKAQLNAEQQQTLCNHIKRVAAQAVTAFQ